MGRHRRTSRMDKIYLALGIALLSGYVSSNLSIVNIIKFENGPCNATGSSLQGTCYTSRECRKYHLFQIRHTLCRRKHESPLRLQSLPHEQKYLPASTRFHHV